jgi:hypothetical protein
VPSHIKNKEKWAQKYSKYLQQINSLKKEVSGRGHHVRVLWHWTAKIYLGSITNTHH